MTTTTNQQQQQQNHHHHDAEDEITDPVTSKLTVAMQELAIKGEMQRREKAEKELQRQKFEEEERERLELEAIRQARLARMKKEAEKLSQDGNVREIAQDDVLPLVLNTPRVIMHFYSNGFEMCALMNKRLELLASKHVESLFVKINAEKAPFFIERLGIRTLPTLVCFEDGKAIGKQIGFQGIDINLPEQDTILKLEEILDGIGVLDAHMNENRKKVPSTTKTSSSVENSLLLLKNNNILKEKDFFNDDD
jgi:hypothetical protein